MTYINYECLSLPFAFSSLPFLLFSIYLFICPMIYVSNYLSICFFVLSVYLLVCQLICLRFSPFNFHYFFSLFLFILSVYLLQKHFYFHFAQRFFLRISNMSQPVNSERRNNNNSSHSSPFLLLIYVSSFTKFSVEEVKIHEELLLFKCLLYKPEINANGIRAQKYFHSVPILYQYFSSLVGFLLSAFSFIIFPV